MTQPNCDCHYSVGGARFENPCCPTHGVHVERLVEPIAEGPDRFACGHCAAVNVWHPRKDQNST